MTFAVHERLRAEAVPLWDWGLSTVLLMNDRRFPWLILVPRRAGLRDLHDVAPADKSLLQGEMDRAALALQRATGAEKMNVAALGNLVPQLHIHVIARFAADAAWPRPAWGVGTVEPYTDDEIHDLRRRLETELARNPAQ